MSLSRFTTRLHTMHTRRILQTKGHHGLSTSTPPQVVVNPCTCDVIWHKPSIASRNEEDRSQHRAELCETCMMWKCADEIKAADESSTRVLEEPRAKEVASKSADATDRS